MASARPKTKKFSLKKFKAKPKGSEEELLGEKLREWRLSPQKFVQDLWNLTPQPLKKEYQDREIESFDEPRPDWFEPFVKGKHITWQQWLILSAFGYAQRGLAPRRIAVKSGHGIGKDATAAWLILWYLICFEDAQIPCTAPTHDQLYDVLWKEIAVWLLRMPDKFRRIYDWNSEYVRNKARPETWFARARTGRKENPEALAGVHGAHVFVIADEASGVDDVVFSTMEGALTGEDFLLFMISNPTRTIGYFRNAFKQPEKWQLLSFDSRESPIVEWEYVHEMEDLHGLDSDEYAIRVAGEFPNEDGQDEEGYMPLFTESMLNFTQDRQMPGYKRMGVDPAGDGSDKAAWAVRTQGKALICALEDKSTAKGIAQRTLTQMDYYGVPPQECAVDNFGVGADVGKEAALLIPGTDLFTINVGEPASEPELYLDKRAEAFWKFRMWCISGGELVAQNGLKEELMSIRFRRDRKGRIEIMPKVKMRKLGLRSPNMADALMLTFVKGFATITTQQTAKVVQTRKTGRRGY